MASCYDLCQFPQPPSGDSRCPVDGGVLRDAVRSKRCGHVYGMQCALTHLMRVREACPVCSAPMDAGDLEPAEAVRSRIMALPIACREIDACPWVGTVAEEPAHAHGPYCGVYMVQCPFCKERVREGPAFEAHKEVCPEAIVVCGQCYEDMPRKELAMHERGIGGRVCRLTTPMKRQKEAAMAAVRARQEEAERRAKEQQAAERAERMSFHQSMAAMGGGGVGATPEPHSRSYRGSHSANVSVSASFAAANKVDDAEHLSIIRDDSASPHRSGDEAEAAAQPNASTRPSVPPPAVDTTATNADAADASACAATPAPPSATDTNRPASATNDDEAAAEGCGVGADADAEEENADPSVFFDQLPATVDSLQAALFDLTHRHESLERRHYQLQQTVFDLIDYISSRDISSSSSSRPAMNGGNSNTANQNPNHSSAAPSTSGTSASASAANNAAKASQRSVKPMFVPDVAKKAAFDYVFAGMKGGGGKSNGGVSPSAALTPQRQLFGQRGGSPQPARPHNLPPLSTPQSATAGDAPKGKATAAANGRPHSSPVASASARKAQAMGFSTSGSSPTSARGYVPPPQPQLKPKAPSAPPTASEGMGYRRASVSVASSAASSSRANSPPAAAPPTTASSTAALSSKRNPTIAVSAGTPVGASNKARRTADASHLSTVPNASGSTADSSLSSTGTTTNRNRPHPSAAVLAAGVSVAGGTPRSPGGGLRSPIQYSHRVGQGKGVKAASPAPKK